MARTLSPEEARDQKVAELTEKHLEARRALLSKGDEHLTSSVCEALWAELTDPLWQGMVQICQTEPEVAGTALAMIVGKVLRADAEVEALRDVEQLEKDREEAAGEARVEQAVWERVGN